MNNFRVSTSALILALASPTVMADYGGKQRIVGGTDANKDQWPWMVSLQMADAESSADGHICGASLVNDRWILTASHCIEGMTNDNADELQVRLGGHDLSESNEAGQAFSIKRILQHPRYDNVTTDNDIALLELANTSTRTQIAPIDSVDMQLVVPGTSLTVTGWGARSENDQTLPTVLQQVDVPMVSKETCNAARNGEDGELTDNMLCAGPAEGGKDSCYGDSGGPLMVQQNGSWKQVGIVSWGIECAGENQYGVYARVANYGQWLAQHQTHLSQDTYIDFGYLPENYAVTKTLGIHNNSSQTQTVTQLNVGETNGLSVALKNNQCTDQGLAEKQSCTVDVEISGPQAGRFDVTITGQATEQQGLMETHVVGEVLQKASFASSISDQDLTFYTSIEPPMRWIDNDGQTALRSARNATNDVSPLLTIVKGPTQVSFEWRLSAELDDQMAVMLDGRPLDVEPPTTQNWQKVTVEIPEGEHRLLWLFQKGNEAPEADRHLLIQRAKVTHPLSTKKTDSKKSGGGTFGLALFLCLLPFAIRRGRV